MGFTELTGYGLACVETGVVWVLSIGSVLVGGIASQRGGASTGPTAKAAPPLQKSTAEIAICPVITAAVGNNFRQILSDV
jgi:hypothetical protein